MTPTVPRRTLLATGAAGTALVPIASRTPALAGPDRPVFAHGVASGDPEPTSVVIWTRVSPTAAATPGSGKGPRVDVRWEVATDRAFRHVVRSGSFEHRAGARPHRQGRRRPGWRRVAGTTTASPTPATRSRTGRTRTAPRAGSDPRRLRVGVVSCSQLRGRLLRGVPPPRARTTASTRCSTSATTSTSRGAHDGRVRRARARPRDPQRWPTTGSATRSTRPTPTCRTCTRGTRSSSRGTTTRSPTTPGRTARRTTRPARATTCGAGPAPTARTTSGCRCGWTAPPTCATAPGCSGGCRWGSLAEISMLDLRSYRDRMVSTAAPFPLPQVQAEADDPDRTITGEQQMALAQGVGGPRHRPVEADRQLGDDRAALDGAAARRRGRPDRPGHRRAPLRRRPVQHRPVGRLHRRPARAASPTSPSRGQRHRLPHRRHPLRVGRRPAARPGRLPARRHGGRGVRLHLGHLRQHRRPDRRSPAHHDAGHRGGPQGQQPPHQVRQLRRPRLLRARRDRGAGTHGLLRRRGQD